MVFIDTCMFETFYMLLNILFLKFKFICTAFLYCVKFCALYLQKKRYKNKILYINNPTTFYFVFMLLQRCPAFCIYIFRNFFKKTNLQVACNSVCNLGVGVVTKWRFSHFTIESLFEKNIQKMHFTDKKSNKCYVAYNCAPALF